ncbi:hypothetical protein FUAX_36810 [Fulvitalea axinellae]|uniref:Class II aldolase/adducin N-terminal domain-containing protein n=1 Tax=Fulvitalea axinellae TaxID=1182444 RepID=A0AAU9CGD6_9BACT|nr:hypothetical protein FUAX_36810 [Fulvitalea axinellae]
MEKSSDWKITPKVPDFEYKWTPGSDPITRDEVEEFFHSAPIRELKERMCLIGKKMWTKDFVDGNGGNITIRVGDNLALSTPTLISKGFMTPNDICLVNLDGDQKAGSRPRTSEAKTHLAIMKAVPEAKSCIHAHPPHSTAFAITDTIPPTGLCSEPDIFLGEVGTVPYATPGSKEIGDLVAAAAPDHQCILMQNHGVIVWGKDVEDAYWKLENLDAFCRTLLLATQHGGTLRRMSPEKIREIIEIRKVLSMRDKREDWTDEQLLDYGGFKGAEIFQMREEESQA